MPSHLEELDISSLSIEADRRTSSDEVSGSASTISEPSTAESEISLRPPRYQASRLAALTLPNRIVREYLGNHNPVFRELDILREKVSLISNKLCEQALTPVATLFRAGLMPKVRRISRGSERMRTTQIVSSRIHSMR